MQGISFFKKKKDQDLAEVKSVLPKTIEEVEYDEPP